MNEEWVENRKENFRVEVSHRYLYTSTDMALFAKELNTLFSEHRDFSNAIAQVNYDVIKYCKLCNTPYEEYFDENKRNGKTATTD